MAEIKTKASAASVTAFLDRVEPEVRRKDAFVLLGMMRRTTGLEPRMWGPSIIGFGDWRYRSPATGREGDWFRVGFSPRKASMSVYLMGGLDKHGDALAKLGKWKRGAGCLYINKLADVDLDVLETMIARAFAELH